MHAVDPIQRLAAERRAAARRRYAELLNNVTDDTAQEMLDLMAALSKTDEQRQADAEKQRRVAEATAGLLSDAEKQRIRQRSEDFAAERVQHARKLLHEHIDKLQPIDLHWVARVAPALAPIAGAVEAAIREGTHAQTNASNRIEQDAEARRRIAETRRTFPDAFADEHDEPSPASKSAPAMNVAATDANVTFSTSREYQGTAPSIAVQR